MNALGGTPSTILRASGSFARRWPLVITFDGPDGSGKSTLANALTEWLQDNDVSVRTARSRPKSTQRLRTSEYDYNNPHKTRQRGRVESLARVGAKYVFYVARWIVEARPTSKPTVLIRERGWLDYAIDSRRYGLAPVVKPLVRALNRIFPQPDSSFVLVGDAQAMHDRKPDLDVGEIERVVSEWSARASASSRHVALINTTDQTTESALEELLGRVIESPARTVLGTSWT